ncbi:MAG: hypothetical protein NW216_02310 [Hyphomicrobium sp.]|nr:hypothetical protein [Hyphomicrobium sp.]
MAGFESVQLTDDTGFPGEIKALLQAIAQQIETADLRHSSLLEDMRSRLVALAEEAERVRGEVPSHFDAQFARIEASLRELGFRLGGAESDAVEPDHDRSSETFGAPLALRSAQGAVAHPAAPRAGDIDTFDVIGDEVIGEVGHDELDAWDRASAEALTQSYEAEDPDFIRSTPVSAVPSLPAAPIEAELDAEASEFADDAEFTSEPPMAVVDHVSSAFAEPPVAHAAEPNWIAPGGPAMSAQDDDRLWLDQRLSDIAHRIEQSLLDVSPDRSIAVLSERFSVLEERLVEALQDVATRADVDGLKVVEGHIAELALHIENAENQLGRLDTIEQQLIAVVEQLADQRLQGGPQPDAATSAKFHELAETTAEQVAQRLAATLQTRPASDSQNEVSDLLRSFIEERRQSDEQTYSLLDTVQQAMIRVLDRMDALEEGRATTPPPAPHAFATFAATETPPVRHAIPDIPTLDPVTAAPAFHDDTLRPALDVEPDETDDVPSAAPVATSAIDKLRADFIADAQRAKLRAAAEAMEAPAAATPPSTIEAMKAAARRKPAPAQAATAKPVAADGTAKKPSRKLLLAAIALALVMAAGGQMLFSKKSKDADAPQAQPTAQVPAGGAGAGIDAPIAPNAKAPDGAETPASPAKERSSFLAPVAPGGSGAGFAVETGPDEIVPAPTRSSTGPGPGSVTRAGLGIEGIVLQNADREPTAQELAHLKSQQQAAELSSRLGQSAARLGPAALMPEEVARTQDVTAPFATGNEQMPEMPLVAAAYQPEAGAATAPRPTDAVSQLSNSANGFALPPAAVGPLSLRLAAAKGDPSAEFEVGARLAEGKGIDQNFKEAHRWYQRSADQGFAQAQYRLGTLYERGLGAKKDLAVARQWYEKAAEQGNVKAMHNLAVLSAGRETQSPDYALAAQWFQSAAEYGLADSQFNLAVLRENGLGIAKDLKIAYKWYALAAKGGDKEAQRRRQELKAGLAPQDIADAERAAGEFQAKRPDRLVNDARAAGEDWKSRQATNEAQ